MTIIALSTLSATSFAADAKDKVNIKAEPEQKIGNWYYQCETMQVNGKDKNKVCALVQNFAILGKDKKQEMPVLRLQIHKIKQAEKMITFLGVRTPLGVDLASGVKLQIDKKDYKGVPFTTCYAEPLGCRSSFIIEKDLEKALLGGKELRIGYKSLDGRVVASEIQTGGYTEAINKL